MPPYATRHTVWHAHTKYLALRLGTWVAGAAGPPPAGHNILTWMLHQKTKIALLPHAISKNHPFSCAKGVTPRKKKKKKDTDFQSDLTGPLGRDECHAKKKKTHCPLVPLIVTTTYVVLFSYNRSIANQLPRNDSLATLFWRNAGCAVCTGNVQPHRRHMGQAEGRNCKLETHLATQKESLGTITTTKQ